jgi:tRNA(fMet)-specific endonuclease VapC
VTHLVDTDMCVDGLRDREPVATHLRTTETECAVAVSTVAELLYGAARSRRPGYNQSQVAELVAGMTVLPFDWDCALTFGQLKADLQERGQLIPDFDLVVAATALTHSLTLVTANTAHFARIPKLRVENWREAPAL